MRIADQREAKNYSAFLPPPQMLRRDKWKVMGGLGGSEKKVFASPQIIHHHIT